MVSVCGFAFVNSVAGPASSGWLPDRCHVDDRRGEAEGQVDSRDVADIERESTEGGGLSCSNNPWANSDISTSTAVEESTDAISVRMSIWRDLCAGHQADERQVSIIRFFYLTFRSLIYIF